MPRPPATDDHTHFGFVLDLHPGGAALSGPVLGVAAFCHHAFAGHLTAGVQRGRKIAVVQRGEKPAGITLADRGRVGQREIKCLEDLTPDVPRLGGEVDAVELENVEDEQAQRRDGRGGVLLQGAKVRPVVLERHDLGVEHAGMTSKVLWGLCETAELRREIASRSAAQPHASAREFDQRSVPVPFRLEGPPIRGHRGVGKRVVGGGQHGLMRALALAGGLRGGHRCGHPLGLGRIHDGGGRLQHRLASLEAGAFQHLMHEELGKSARFDLLPGARGSHPGSFTTAH